MKTYTQEELNKELDRMQIKVFLGNDNAFLSSLLSQLKVSWSDKVPTAGVNCTELLFNPDFVMALKPDQRAAILLHELWHVARMHQFRRNNRDFALWNIACDFRINNDLVKDKIAIDSIQGILLDKKYDYPEPWTEEDIYDDLKTQGNKHKEHMQDLLEEDSDTLEKMSEDEIKKAMQKVATAINNAATQAKMMDKNFSLDALGMKEHIEGVLSIRYPWHTVLAQWFDELFPSDWTWSRPNRRHEEYLPSVEQELIVRNVNLWLDTSGSMSEEDVRITLNIINALVQRYPDIKCHLWNFDTEVYDKKTISRNLIKSIEITGRGGTDIEPVMKAIATRKDQIHIIISDMYFEYVPVPKGVEKLLFIVPKNHDSTNPYKHRKICYEHH